MISCPICGSRTGVEETRPSGAGLRRRRGCVVVTCPGKVTTLEVIVPDRQAAALGKGFVLVPVRLIGQLRDALAAIGGGDL